MFDFKTTRNFIILALVCTASVAVLNLRSIKHAEPIALGQPMMDAESARSGINQPQPIKLKNDHDHLIARRAAQHLELSNSRNPNDEFAVQQASHQYRVEWTSESKKPLELDAPERMSKLDTAARRLADPWAPATDSLEPQPNPAPKRDQQVWESETKQPITIQPDVAATPTLDNVAELEIKPIELPAQLPPAPTAAITGFEIEASSPTSPRYPLLQQTVMEADNAAPILVADAAEVQIPERLKKILHLDDPIESPSEVITKVENETEFTVESSSPNPPRYPLVQQTAMEADNAPPTLVTDAAEVEIPERLKKVLHLNDPVESGPDVITKVEDEATLPQSSPADAEPAGKEIAKEIAKQQNDTGFTQQPDETVTRVAENPGSDTKTKPVFQPSNTLLDNEFRVANASKSKTAQPAREPTPKEPGKKPAPAKKAKDKTPRSLIGADNYVLAGQPQIGDHWKDDTPLTDRRAFQVESSPHNFSPDPIDPYTPYDPYAQMQVYEGKTLHSNQRPLVELGRPWYQLGQLSPGYSWFGKHNNVTPQFLVYGDVRTAIASSSANGEYTSQLAAEVNLDFDLKLTSTERFHAFWSPLDDGVNNTRYLFDEDEFVGEFDAQFDFGYFEGDLGAITGGFIDKTLPFDLPFAVGVIPMLVQNGVWMEDAILGVAATIPARNSPRFNISNMDITFFAGYDKITSDAFPGDDSAARMYGMLTFIEAMNGYFEIDYAFLDDRTFDDRSYHNIGIGFTRRYGSLISNSTRVIVNAGQNSAQVENTADGVLLLSENSLITSAPSTFVPYANFFAGFDRPQSAARAGQAGDVLRNTGILFETDGITGFPTLDATANDTFGGAVGLNIIADDFSQQLVLETAFVGTMGDDATRNAPGPQFGLGFRYQLPLTNAIIFRTDGMYGFMDGQDDVRGLRFELRHKY